MDFAEVKELQSKNYINTINKLNICLTHGDGNKLYDTYGREYIDFMGGIGENILGYNHPGIKEALLRQIEMLINSSDMFYTEIQAVLGELLLENTIFDKALLCNSGAEALAASLRMIRKFYSAKKVKRNGILIVSESMRGISYGREIDAPASPREIKFSPPNDIELFKKSLTDDIGTVVMETLQLDNGFAQTKYDFLINAYAMCKSKGVLLLINESVTGLGRTGSMYSFEYSGIQPDVIIISKGLGGGIPMSAVLARGEIAYSLSTSDQRVLNNSYTLACASACAVLKTLKDGMIDEIANLGDYMRAKLSKAAKHNFITDIRGSGLMLGIELDERVRAHEIVTKMSKEGILIFDTPTNNTLIFMPPYTITRGEIDIMVEKLMKLFAETNV